MKELLKDKAVADALKYIEQDDDRTFSELLRLCVIKAPSHHEERRAEHIKEKFEEIGLEDVYIDEVLNVFGTIKGSEGGSRAILAAHTDIVFPESVELKVEKTDDGKYYCPGINDDTKAVTELFTIARAMINCNVRPRGDLVFCANVCEEGLGDLKGVKHIFGKSRDYSAFVSIDNPVSGGIVYYGTGSARFEVTFKGPGGHSFGDFGLASPIHALGRAIGTIADFRVPDYPKTTFNVGVISGGTSVNTISESARMLVDFRSDSPDELGRLVGEMKAAVAEAANSENARRSAGDPLEYEIEQVGDRPAGSQPADAPIVKAAWEAALLTGLKPELRNESSTDANIPISLGIPALTVGRGGQEGGVHTVHEWHKRDRDYLAPQRTLLLMLSILGYKDTEPLL